MNISNTVISWLLNFIETISGPLTSPFVILTEMVPDSQLGQILRWVNYIIPVYTWISILEAWLLCIAIYYGISVILRWLHAIS